jgi:DNA polymerase-4/protein ImuB
MKVACILIPHFPLKAEIIRQPGLKDLPVLIISTSGSRRVVYDFFPYSSGVSRGMELHQAVTYEQNARLIEADEGYYQAQFDEILDALAERSPVIEEADLGCAYADLNGLEAMYGGPSQLTLSFQSAVARRFEARFGLAQGKFMAYLAALSAEPGRTLKAPAESRAFLDAFSVEVLPVSFKIKAQLHQFNLHSLRDVAALPLGALQAQFGPPGKVIWELANGIDNAPLLPRRPEERISESLSFTDPTGAMGTIMLGVQVLLDRVFLRPELRGRCARLIDLEAGLYLRAPWAKTVTFKEPVGEPAQALRRIKSVLEGAAIPGALEDLTVTLKDLAGEQGRQGGIFAEVRRREQVRQALRQLDAILGRQAPVFQVREVEPWSRVPERRHALVPAAR